MGHGGPKASGRGKRFRRSYTCPGRAVNPLPVTQQSDALFNVKRPPLSGAVPVACKAQGSEPHAPIASCKDEVRLHNLCAIDQRYFKIKCSIRIGIDTDDCLSTDRCSLNIIKPDAVRGEVDLVDA